MRRHPTLPQPSHPAAGPAVGSGAGTTATVAIRAATGAEEVGVVDVTTVLDFGAGRAAGTGIILPTGEILTNNHVIRDATQITVTVVATGASSAADVVGTDPTDDVAVLRLSGGAAGASASLATEAARVAVGDVVVAVGNAEGAGGTPTAAPGTLVGLNQNITASDGGTGVNAVHLTGLIEFTAAIAPGDSGGPLYDNGTVIGIDTAGSVVRSGAGVAGPTHGFAIPISTATAIADRILTGEQSNTIHQGRPAFLGVEIASGPRTAAGGARIAAVVASSPAASAGLHAGDAITAIDATTVDNPGTVAAVLAAHHPDDQITITWTDGAGAVHTATATLTAAPRTDRGGRVGESSGGAHSGQARHLPRPRGTSAVLD